MVAVVGAGIDLLALFRIRTQQLLKIRMRTRWPIARIAGRA